MRRPAAATGIPPTTNIGRGAIAIPRIASVARSADPLRPPDVPPAWTDRRIPRKPRLASPHEGRTEHQAKLLVRTLFGARSTHFVTFDHRSDGAKRIASRGLCVEGGACGKSRS